MPTTTLTQTQNASTRVITSGGMLLRGLGFGMAEIAGGIFPTYREMLCNPTIAIARIAATAPIKTAAWSYVASGDDVPDEWIAFVQSNLNPLRRTLVRDMCRGIDFGFAAFEKVWQVKDGRMNLVAVKPLLPDCTTLRISQTGELVGIDNLGTTLGMDKAFVYSHDVEADNWYGRSRLENIRETAWRAWQDAFGKSGRYTSKMSSIIPIAHYPVGTSPDSGGTVRDNGDIAKDLLTRLANAGGVALPKVLQPGLEDALRQGADVESLMAWSVSFLESRAGHGTEMIEMLRHWERLMARGYLCPERAITEGEFGTKADAEQHSTTLVAAADETTGDITECVNRGLVDDLLVMNFGESARGKVRIEHAQTDPAAVAFVRKIVGDVLVNPANVDILQATADVDAMLDQAGIPKAKEVVDINVPSISTDPTALARSMYVGMLDRMRHGLSLASGPHKYGCFLIELPADVAAEIRAIAAEIDPADLTDEGIEASPHVTLKYGCVGEVDAAKVLDGVVPFEVEIGDVSFFSGDSDVLKFNAWGNGLHRLNELISSEVPHIDNHSLYDAHATIAYLKPGKGLRYTARFAGLSGRKIQVSSVIYSAPDGTTQAIALK